MTFETTYKIAYIVNGKTFTAWLGVGDRPENYDDALIIETIPVVCAEPGYEIWHEGASLGEWAVVKFPHDEYTERPYEPDFDELEEMHEADL